MQTAKVKTVCQSSQILRTDSSTKILSCSTNFGNNIIVYSTHIDFRGNKNSYDQNAVAIQAHFTTDGAYLIIWVLNPNSLHIINVKNGDIFIARGIDNQGGRTIGVSVQPEQGLKAGKQTRKIYLILQQRGIIGFKIIQMQPKIDNSPKTRSKLLQQNTDNIRKALPIFSYNRWNNFILCRKQIMRVCRPANRNDNIQFDFTIQSFEKNLAQLCSTFNIIAIAEGANTWALLCGNSHYNRNQSNMVLNIFWQHCSGNDLTRNMYYKDSAFVKVVQLPLSQKYFVNLKQVNGFYLVETQEKQTGTHLCHIIFQQNGLQLVTLNLSDNSAICPFTLLLNQSQVSICQIVNQNQLKLVKLHEIQNNQQNLTSQNKTSTRTEVKISTINSNKNENKQQNIKKFQVVDENNLTTEIKDNQISANGKVTAKKNESNIQKNSQEQQETKNLINKKLVEHLTKNQETNLTQSQDEIQAPTILQNVVSFGAPGTGDKNLKDEVDKKESVKASVISFGAASQIKITKQKQSKVEQKNVNTTLMSFGAKQKNSPSTSKNTSVQINKKVLETSQKLPQKQQKIVLDKTKVKQIRQVFHKLQNKIFSQLLQRQQSLKQNYSIIDFKQLIKFQPPFSSKQLKLLLNTQKIVKNYNYYKKQKQIKKNIQANQIKKLKLKLNYFNNKLIMNFRKLQINLNQQNKQFQKLRNLTKYSKLKKNNTLQQDISKDFKQIQHRICILQQNSVSTYKRYVQKIKGIAQANIQKASKNKMNKKTKYSFNSPLEQKKSKQYLKAMPIPIFRSIILQQQQPLIQLTPL